MRSSLLTTLAGAIGLVLASTASASAATLHIDDPDRDGMHGAGLDITSATVRNNDHAIVMTVRFRQVTLGDMAIVVRLSVRSATRSSVWPRSTVPGTTGASS